MKDFQPTHFIEQFNNNYSLMPLMPGQKEFYFVGPIPIHKLENYLSTTKKAGTIHTVAVF